jgi:hypothetical protein
MKQLSPRELSTKIAKESSGIVIRVGRTNGKDVLHLRRQRNDEKGIEAASVTIPATVTAWDLHEWNPLNNPKPKKKREDDNQ